MPAPIPEPPNFMLGDRVFFFYRAIVTDHYDGDTITLSTDLGKRTWNQAEPHRLHRINTPEIRGAEKEQGLISAKWLEDKLPIGTELMIETIKGPHFRDRKGKYGRYLAELWHVNVNLNDELVRLGLAEYVDY